MVGKEQLIWIWLDEGNVVVDELVAEVVSR